MTRRRAFTAIVLGLLILCLAVGLKALFVASPTVSRVYLVLDADTRQPIPGVVVRGFWRRKGERNSSFILQGIARKVRLATPLTDSTGRASFDIPANTEHTAFPVPPANCRHSLGQPRLGEPYEVPAGVDKVFFLVFAGSPTDQFITNEN